MAGNEWTDVEPELKVRVLQWNVLADSCADDSAQGFPSVPVEALDTDLRRPMQINEIISADAGVIALEEVDNPKAFEEALTENGYKVLYNRREDSQLGVLVAYKEAKYTLKAKTMITFTKGGQVATVLKLKDKTSGRSFVFAATHLKAKDDYKSKRVREYQSKELLIHVKAMSDDWTERNRPFASTRDAELKGNIVLAGDLNDDEDSRAVKTWTEQDEFKSAYKRYLKTTFKECKNDCGFWVNKCCTEDYVIHNGTTARVLTLPQDFEVPYLPSKVFPSDHLILCTDIVFVN